jgi:hypothetical protein
MKRDPFRTLDDPDPPPRIASESEAEFRKHAAGLPKFEQAVGYWMLPKTPNVWQRFWARALLGIRWN